MSFQVTLQPSGHSFEVAENEFVLDAAMRHAIDLPYGCRNGVCASCAATLLSGEVSYLRKPDALSASMQHNNQALLCMAIPISDLVIQTDEFDEMTLPVKKLRCRLEQKQKLSHDVMLIKIKIAGAERLQYHAGQYVEFILEDGRRRAFSLANAPHADSLLELHVRHVNGGFFTDYLFDLMPDKSMLRVEGPLGQFYLRENTNRPIILMGGGTGFGPIKAIVEHILHTGIKQKMYLFMGVRALRDLYMQPWTSEWTGKHPEIMFTPVLSEPLPEDNWQGATGYVHTEVQRQFKDLSGFDIYMSGPPPMVTAAVAAFETQGATREHMYSDAFEYSTDALRAISQSGAEQK